MKMRAKFMYVGIRVTDLQKSIDFYTKLLGMKVVGGGKVAQTNGETVNLESEKDGFNLELNHYGENSRFNTEYDVGEGLDHLAFKVDDLDEILKEAHLMGHRTVLDITSDNVRWAYIEDPNGIWIELF